MRYFDIHSHLHSDFFKNDIDSIISKMKEQEIYTISVGVSGQDSVQAVKLAKKNKNFYASIGIHPTEKEDFNENFFQKLYDQNKNKIVAVGECGLDYYWPNQDLKIGKISEADFASEKKRQKILFQKQLDFALKNDLPLMLHIRSFQDTDAHWEALKILADKEEEFGKKIRANFHFFTEGVEVVRKVIEAGYYISYPGVITFAVLDNSVFDTPVEKIMVETDSPFATPAPYRGQTNSPIFLPEIIKKISQVKKIEIVDLKKQLIKNTLEFFKIKV